MTSYGFIVLFVRFLYARTVEVGLDLGRILGQCKIGSLFSHMHKILLAGDYENVFKEYD